jgi:hypothetical protein
MGRPRKHPLPESTAPGPALTALPTAPEPEHDDEELTDDELEPEPEELVSLALDNARLRLTPAMVAALNQAWKDNVRADDDEGKAYARRIAARLKRASHGELHPGCHRITITVPTLRRRNGGIWYVTINERKYIGKVDVWECEARTIFALAHNFDIIENERMDEGRAMHPTFDLDTGTAIAERARLIREA